MKDIDAFTFHHLTPYVEQARSGDRAVVAVAGGADRQVLATMDVTARAGMARAILFGDARSIREEMEDLGISGDHFRIVDCPDDSRAALEAARCAGGGEADILMKGFVSSGTFLRAVLNEEAGLRTRRTLSHVGVFDVPSYDRVLMMTDGGINIEPDFDVRVDIVKNAIDVAGDILGRPPRVALVAAVEKVQANMPVTLHWAAISKMAERGQLGDAVVDGPLGLDNALSPEALKMKNIGSPVQGSADVLVVPDIQAGNLLGKSLTYLADAPMAGLVVGAAVPVVLNSRVDSPRARLSSLIMARAARGS